MRCFATALLPISASPASPIFSWICKPFFKLLRMIESVVHYDYRIWEIFGSNLFLNYSSESAELIWVWESPSFLAWNTVQTVGVLICLNAVNITIGCTPTNENGQVESLIIMLLVDMSSLTDSNMSNYFSDILRSFKTSCHALLKRGTYNVVNILWGQSSEWAWVRRYEEKG